MRHFTLFGALLGVLLSVLILGAPQAGAQGDPAGHGGIVCPDGSGLVEGRCLVDEGPVCPDGFALADGQCITTVAPTDVPCPDGATAATVIDTCVRPLAPGEANPPCPDGADDSLGLCYVDEGPITFQVDPPPIGDPSCPIGTRGVAPGCFIYEPRGPAEPCPGGQTPVDGICEFVDRPCVNGLQLGDICAIEGPLPEREPGTCPEGREVVFDGVDCFRTVFPIVVGGCTQPYVATSEPFSVCRYEDPNFDTNPTIFADFDCPGVAGETPVAVDFETQGGAQFARACEYDDPGTTSVCPAGSSAVGTECRVAVPLIPGDFFCVDGFEVVSLANNRSLFVSFATDFRCLALASSNPVPVFERPCTDHAITDEQGNCRRILTVSLPTRCTAVPHTTIGLDVNTCVFGAELVDPASCANGFSIDDLLGYLCAQNEVPDQGDPSCPDGARGIVNGCHIFVARGPGECAEGLVAIDDLCHEVADRIGTDCPATFTEINGGCVRQVPPIPAVPCTSNEPNAGDICLERVADPVRAPGICPDAPDIIDDGINCYRLAPFVDGVCPGGSTQIGNECRVAVPLIPGALSCPVPGSGLVDGRCVVIADVELPVRASQCPTGSFDQGNGFCRKPVANALGAFSCPAADTQLQGRICVRVEGPAADGCQLGEPINGRCLVEVDPLIVVPCTNADVFIGLGDCVDVGLGGPVECPDMTAFVGNGSCEGVAAPACSLNQVIGDNCVREVAPVDCPADATAFRDGRCLVALGDICPVDYGFDGTVCVFLGAPIAPMVCPDQTYSASVVDGCGFPFVVNPFSAEGGLVQCVSPDPSATTVRFDNECFERLRLPVQCPPAFSPDDSLGGVCTRFEPVIELADGTRTCPDGSADESLPTINGRSCVFTADFVTDGCPAGFTEVATLTCDRPIAITPSLVCDPASAGGQFLEGLGLVCGDPITTELCSNIFDPGALIITRECLVVDAIALPTCPNGFPFQGGMCFDEVAPRCTPGQVIGGECLVPTTPEPAGFVAVNPCAVFDTRSGTAFGAPLTGQDTVTAQIEGPLPGSQTVESCAAVGVVPAEATAVMVNVVAVNPTASGNLRIAASGEEARGGVVNFGPGTNGPGTNSNAVPVALSAGGAVDVTVNAPSGIAATHVRLVVLGYYVDPDVDPAAQAFVPVTPCALFDSRSGPAIAGQRTVTADVQGFIPAQQTSETCAFTGVVPESATGVMVNVVAVNPLVGGNLRVSAAGTPANGGVVNFGPGDNGPGTNANAVPVALGDRGSIQVEVNAPAGVPATHIRLVVLGYYTDFGPASAGFVPITPCAVLDTRSGVGFGGPATGQTTTPAQIADTLTGAQTTELCGTKVGGAVPADATAVMVNVVAVAPSTGGNLQISAAGAQPGGGVVNFGPGTAGPGTNSNAVPVALGPGGLVDVFANAATGASATHLRLVVLGYYR